MRRRAALISVVVALILTSAIRLRLADVPLERDEGEYAYAGQLILQGEPPYRHAYNMKFPGTYYGYAAVLATFGQSPRALHVGLLLLIAATTLVVFALARRLMSDVGAAAAAITFAVLSMDRYLNGIFMHATHFVALPALGAFLAVIRARDSDGLGRPLVAGVLVGIAVLMKQHAVVYAPLAALLLIGGDRANGLSGRRLIARAAALVVGLALPLGLVAAVLAAQGVFDRFWFWTIDYARAYVSERSVSDMTEMLRRGWASTSRVSLPIWELGAAGLAPLWLTRWPWSTRWWLTSWTVASFAAICPGFYFRPHYFVLLVPSVSLLTGILVASLDRFAGRWLPRWVAGGLAALPCAFVLGQYAYTERVYLSRMPMWQVSRQVYARNPFVEAPEIARYIRDRTTPADRIAVIGNEPEIYFYANRRSATGYLYTYALMEPQPYAARMQREMIEEIEAARPAFIVFPGRWSWNITPESDRTILEWADRYVERCYDKVGVMDLHSLTAPVWLWDEAALGYQPQSPFLLHTYRRRSDASCAGATLASTRSF